MKTVMGSPAIMDPNKTVMGSAPSLNATVTIKPIQCPVCKTFNPIGLAFCKECGLIFEKSLDGDAFGAPEVKLPVLVDTTGREYVVRPGTQVIGRQGDIMIDDGRISRRHARVNSMDGQITVEELGSTNGTTVDGNGLTVGQPMPIVEGMEISLGGLTLKLSMPGSTNKTEMSMGGRTQSLSAAPTVRKCFARLKTSDSIYDIPLGKSTFGRRDSNDVIVSNAFVSGNHGEFLAENDQLTFTDIGSTNGSSINGTKLEIGQGHPVADGDVLRIGELELKFEIISDLS